MYNNQGDVIQWKRLWQLVSGINFETPTKIVNEQLSNVSAQLLEGLKQFHPPKSESDQKLKELLKKLGQEKLLAFTQKLQQYLNLDAVQAWDILCHYLINEYKGSATSLANYISTESAMLKLLNDIWSYYSLERMTLLKTVKILLEFQGSMRSCHPYAEEYEAVLMKIGVEKLLTSYIEQLEELVTKALPGKAVVGDFFNTSGKLVAWNERNVREEIALLQIIILAVDILDGVKVEQGRKLLEIFKSHSFGRQQQYLNGDNLYHGQLMEELMFHEVALLLKILELNVGQSEEYAQDMVSALNKIVLSLHQYPEHGPLLLVWMLVNFQLKESRVDEEIANKLRQFGSRAIQLKCFEWLLSMISHKTFQDPDSKVAYLVRNSVYNHLCVLCDLFDANTSVCHHHKIYELTAELLKSTNIALDFCEKANNSGLRGLLDVAVENFPVTFTQLSQILSALSHVSSVTNKYIQDIVEKLPVYTEEYIPDKYLLRPSQEQDTFLLASDYRPFPGIQDFVIPSGTEIVVVDKQGHTFCHFRTPINYFTVLHHQIDRLLTQILHYTEIDAASLTKITSGLTFLASVIRRTKHPSHITEFMVHPTEMVFDLLTKFRATQQPPIPLMAVCLRVCTALVPLFDQEIVTRVLNLNILPSIKTSGLSFNEYANGNGFDPELVGNYLINFEKNDGRYLFLKEYLEFLDVYKKLQKENFELVDLPGLIFLLREVFPHLHTWKFDSDKTRIEINTLILRHFFDILQPSSHPKKKFLRQICIHSLLHLGNGMPLLRLVAVGNAQLQIIMENESNWMSAGECGVNHIIQLALTILMQILRYKHEVESNESILSPIESLIYTKPKQMDTLRIISVVTSYMNNIFNVRLPILACRLLRRFALEFQMSLLACLDMEPDQIRLIFLQRLRDDLESHQIKVAILEFVESCVEKQPGLTEAFFKISYEHEKRFLETIKANKKKATKVENDGILEYMQEFLDVVKKSPDKIASPLLSRIMALFHSLWKNNMQGLVSDLMEKKEFWGSICAPLFATPIHPDIKAYSQLFNILGVEVFRVTVGAKFDENFRGVIERLLEKSTFEKWLKQIFDLPDETEVLLDSTPEWLCRLQSFKDLMILLLKCKPISSKFPEASKQILATQCLASLIQRTSNMNDTRPLVILAEFYLILLKNYQVSYSENPEDDRKLLENGQKLLEFLAAFYKHLLPRARNSILAICIKVLDLLSSTLVQERSISVGMLESTVEIVSLEILSLETEDRIKPEAPIGFSRDTKKSSAELSLILLKNLVRIIELQPYNNWNAIFSGTKLYNRVLSCVNNICQNYQKRQITVELLDLLVVFASGDCSQELLFSDISEYLWLKLLPPKELLQKGFVTPNTSKDWQMQDWWPIYIKGIQLITKLLETHGHHFKKDVIFFIGIHEEYLLDSLLLVKQCLEPKAVELIKTTLALLCEMCRYEQFWRLEHGQSMANLMRCVQILMDSSVSLLYRPKILKRLVSGGGDDTGSSELDELIETRDLAESTDEIVEVMNELIEIISISSRCLLWFSPSLLTLLCDTEFLPSQYFALIEIQFGAPKLTQDNALSFGTVLSAASIFTKSLNLQQFNFHEKPLNKLPDEEAELDDTDTSFTRISDSNLSHLTTPTHSQPPTQATTPMAGSPRTHFSKSLSMTSVTSFTGPSGIAPSNELLSHLSTKGCVTALELILTLLASQSLLALKSVHLSGREKQLIRRELSTELLQFHDFVRKKVSRESWKRKKFGQTMIRNARESDEELAEEIGDEMDTTIDKTPVPIVKSSDHAKSLRVNLVKKLHQKHITDTLFDTTVPISPINKLKSGVSSARGTKDQSTPLKSILKPTTSTSQKRHVMFEQETDNKDEDTTHKKLCQDEDEPVFVEPDTEPPYTGLSYVKMVEEDYFHFLSNLFLNVAQHE